MGNSKRSSGLRSDSQQSLKLSFWSLESNSSSQELSVPLMKSFFRFEKEWNLMKTNGMKRKARKTLT
jgi:hypothetical protein